MDDARDVIDASSCVVVLCDFQARLMPAMHDKDAVLAVACALAGTARELGIRVIGTEQNPEGLGVNVAEVRDRCDATLAKKHFDACEDGLIRMLDEEKAPAHVVIAGCEAHVCLMQTSLGLLRRGRRVWVVEDGCGSRRDRDRRLAMQRLEHAGATLVSAEMVLFEWLRSSDHPKFRSILQRVKQRV